MFYENKLLTKKSVSKTLKIGFSSKMNTVIDDFCLPLNVAKISYNTDGKSGSLRSYGGVEEFTLGSLGNVKARVSGVKFVNGWYFPKRNNVGEDDHRIVLLGDDGYLYQCYLNNVQNGFVKVDGATFDTSASATYYTLDDADVLLISSYLDDLTVFDGDNAPYSLADAPKMASMAVHYERLFATSGDNILWFSDDLDPTNWNVSLEQAGYIEFVDERGKLLKLLSYDDYLYLFRQYGITRLSAYARQEDFTVTQLYTSGSNIAPKSIKACGNQILFLAGDGIYSFDGLSAGKIAREIGGLFEGVDNSSACAGYKNGKYYLSCKLRFSGENLPTANNCVICLDTVTGEYTVSKGLNVINFGETYLNGVAELLLFTEDNGDKVGVFSDCGQYYGENLVKNHICPETDLGYADRKKDLKFMYINTAEDVTVGVKVDEKWIYLSVSGKTGYQRIGLHAQGEIIQLTLSGKCETMRIRPIFLIYKVY